jgi:RNA polymerase sigma-70 factor (ECF subfamily)
MLKDPSGSEQQPGMQAEMAVEMDADAHVQPISAESLFREQARFVASFVRHMGVDESDLDDVLQDVFVLAHRKGGYLPGAAGPRTWLASLAIRVVIARRRARARRPQATEVTENFADEARGPADLLEARRSLQRVQAALEHLSLEHRAAFILYEIEGESCESIAAMWEVPVGTVYSRLHHARKRFLEVYSRGATRGDMRRSDEP